MIIIDTFIIFALAKRKRDVAQLVARHVRDVEAAGSSPVISTKKTNALLDRAFVVKRRHERKMTGFFTSGGVKKVNVMERVKLSLFHNLMIVGGICKKIGSCIIPLKIHEPGR